MSTTNHSARDLSPVPTQSPEYKSGRGCLSMIVAGLVCVAIVFAAIALFGEFKPT